MACKEKATCSPAQDGSREANVGLRGVDRLGIPIAEIHVSSRPAPNFHLPENTKAILFSRDLSKYGKIFRAEADQRDPSAVDDSASVRAPEINKEQQRGTVTHQRLQQLSLAIYKIQ